MKKIKSPRKIVVQETKNNDDLASVQMPSDDSLTQKTTKIKKKKKPVPLPTKRESTGALKVNMNQVSNVISMLMLMDTKHKVSKF